MVQAGNSQSPLPVLLVRCCEKWAVINELQLQEEDRVEAWLKPSEGFWERNRGTRRITRNAPAEQCSRHHICNSAFLRYPKPGLRELGLSRDHFAQTCRADMRHAIHSVYKAGAELVLPVRRESAFKDEGVSLAPACPALHLHRVLSL